MKKTTENVKKIEQYEAFNQKLGVYRHLHQTVQALNAMGAFSASGRNIPLKIIARFIYADLFQEKIVEGRGGFNKTRLDNVLYGRKSLSKLEAHYFYNSFVNLFGRKAHTISLEAFVSEPLIVLIKDMIISEVDSVELNKFYSLKFFDQFLKTYHADTYHDF